MLYLKGKIKTQTNSLLSADFSLSESFIGILYHWYLPIWMQDLRKTVRIQPKASRYMPIDLENVLHVQYHRNYVT